MCVMRVGSVFHCYWFGCVYGMCLCAVCVGRGYMWLLCGYLCVERMLGIDVYVGFWIGLDEISWYHMVFCVLDVMIGDKVSSIWGGVGGSASMW